MRVLAMIHLAPPRHCAGAEMMLWGMLRPLVERGHQVEALLSRPTPDEAPYEYQDIRVHPHRDRCDPFGFVERADLILTHLENTPRAVTLSRGHHVPVVVLCHNDHAATRQWLVDDALLVYNSEWMRGEFGARENAIVVRPPVVAADYRIRRQGAGAVTLVNLNGDKGSALFYALAERMPDVRFLGVVGAHGEQLVRRDLPNVEIIGHQAGAQGMREVYRRTKLLIMPSVYESWGRVGVEAMCSGIPVIAHPTAGLVESLGDAGTFTDRDDADAWEATVRRLLTPAGYGAASKRALARARELERQRVADVAVWVERAETAARTGLRHRAGRRLGHAVA